MESSAIVIIGAGMAGLSAAERLLTRGFTNVTVLEGQGRVGGRIHTQKYGESSIEMGAQWIHGELANPVFELACKHDLVDLGSIGEAKRKDLSFYLSTGQFICPSVIRETCMVLDNIFNEATKFARELIPLKQSEQETVGAYVQDSFCKHLKTSSDSDDVKKMKEGLLNWRLTMEKTENACASVYDMSLYTWGEYIECAGQEAVELSRGYQPILDLILKNIPDSCFRLNTRVKQIIWNEKSEDAVDDTPRCRVITDGDETFLADHVIVTSSLGYLKAHSAALFQPALPQSKLSAIKRLGFGTVNKIYLEFEKPFWSPACGGIQFAWLPEDHLSLKCLEQLDSSVDYDNTAGEWYKGIHGFDVVAQHTNLLCGWIAGVEAEQMEALPDHLVLNVCHELLKIFTNCDDIELPTKIIRTNWRNNECTLGSYSYRHMGSNVGDSLELARPVPSENEPCIQFAGEATHQTYFSTTHGAMLSGQREADRILNHYQCNRDYSIQSVA